MGEEVMGEQDRLRLLEVRVTGQDEISVRASGLHKRAHRIEHPVLYALCGVPDEKMQVEGDLVVTAPTRMQLERHVADDLMEATLDGGVHGLRREGPRKAP